MDARYYGSTMGRFIRSSTLPVAPPPTLTEAVTVSPLRITVGEIEAVIVGVDCCDETATVVVAEVGAKLMSPM